MLWSERLEQERQKRRIHNTSSRLLELPAELRNHIWELALPQGKFIAVSKDVTEGVCLESAGDAPTVQFHRPGPGATKAFDEGKLLRERMSVMHVCQQMRHEALSLFYQSNTFILRDAGEEMAAWLGSIGQDAVSHIRRIIVTELAADLEDCHGEDLSYLSCDEVHLWRTAMINLQKRDVYAMRNDDEGGLEEVFKVTERDVGIMKQTFKIFQAGGEGVILTATMLMDIVESFMFRSDIQKEARRKRQTTEDE